MKRKLIIDGNAVYEIDEDCMLKRKIKEEELLKKEDEKYHEGQKKRIRNDV